MLPTNLHGVGNTYLHVSSRPVGAAVVGSTFDTEVYRATLAEECRPAA